MTGRSATLPDELLLRVLELVILQLRQKSRSQQRASSIDITIQPSPLHPSTPQQLPRISTVNRERTPQTAKEKAGEGEHRSTAITSNREHAAATA